MKKIVLLVCAFCVFSFAASAQSNSPKPHVNNNAPKTTKAKKGLRAGFKTVAIQNKSAAIKTKKAKIKTGNN